MDLVRKQLFEGADKYANGDEKEATDLICDFVGAKEFILGNIMKYAARILNGDPRQATDTVKIATYALLLYIKLYAPQLEEK